MRLLVIGGTGVVGTAVVNAALARGFSVTSMSRGTSGAARSPALNVFIDRADVEHLRATLIAERPDIVIDTIASSPQHISQVLDALPSLHGYVAVWRGDAPMPAPMGRAVPALVVDLPVVMGPGDVGGALPSWLQRLGDEFVSIVPAELDQPVDCVDSRDVASFLLDSAAARRGGVVTVESSQAAELGDIIGGCSTAITESGGSASQVLPVPSVVLRACNTSADELPLWAGATGNSDVVGTNMNTNSNGGIGSDTERVTLQSRPVEHTIADTLAWLRGSEYFVPLPEDGGPGFTAQRFEEISRAAAGQSKPPAVVSLLEARRHRTGKP